MANELANVNAQSLSSQERTELDNQIAALITQHRGNAYKINDLAFNAAMVITAADKRAKEKSAQGFFKRLGKNIIGKNNRTQNEINQDLAKAQYAAQQILVTLAEQQQLAFELIAAVHSKLNNTKLEIDAELNDVYEILANHDGRVETLEQSVEKIYQEINGICEHLLKTDERVETLERNYDLLNWATTVKIKYAGLDAAAKIVYVARDFYALMRGKQGTINDLHLLVAALDNLGLQTIIRDDFVHQVGTNAQLQTQLLGEDSRLGGFVTEREEIIFDIQTAHENEGNGDRKFFPEMLVKVDANEFTLELLFDLKQLDLMKERSDAAEKLFLDGYITEAMPLLLDTITKGTIGKRNYMFAVVAHEGLLPEGKDPVNAKYHATEGISIGDVCSIFLGARIGFVAKRTAADNFTALKKLADDGDIFAQYEMAHYVSNDAVKYLKLAADKNYFLAAYELGKMYYYGRGGLPEDNDLARKYFEIAAKSEQYGYAMSYLGDIYWNGYGVAVDKKKAADFYKKIFARGGFSDNILSRIGVFYKDEKNYSEAVKWWRIGAEKNFPSCLASLGLAYYYGHGVGKDYSEAVKYFERAIAAGMDNGLPEKHLGDIYWEGGNGITADKKKAVDFYKTAYERGYSSDDSINSIANFYDDDEKNYSEAVKWWRIGAEKNFPSCLASLGLAYYYGHGVGKDYSEAVKYFERAIAAGMNNGLPEKHLGDIYWEGGNGIIVDKKKAVDFYKTAYDRGKSSDGNINRIGTFCDDEKNYSEVVKWWRIGSEKNFRMCLSNLGRAYIFGHGVSKSYSEAATYFERAIAAGEDTGFSEEFLGYIYGEGGYGVTKDCEKAVDFFEKAIAKGTTLSDAGKKTFADALFETGTKYWLGRGVTQDKRKALEFYKRAYDNGITDGYCAYRIGDCNDSLKNYLKALMWFERGAEKGHSLAAFSAGQCYRDGKGTSKDYWEAYTYFKRAIELGGSSKGGIECLLIAKIMLEASREYPDFVYNLKANRAAAVEWFRKAADNGNKDARKWLIDNGEASMFERLIW